MNVKEALNELRKAEKKKFEQSVDLIVNLKGVDAKRDNVSAVVTVPNKIREKKVCAFLSKKSEVVSTITQVEFAHFKDKKELKALVKKYDFFIASAKLMPAVATTFGKVLGPTGKMPSPQLGVLMTEDDNAIKGLLAKISNSIKIRMKEPSIKVMIGKESMGDDQISANAEAVFHGIVNALPTKRENVKNVMIKLTMGKPLKVEIK